MVGNNSNTTGRRRRHSVAAGILLFASFATSVTLVPRVVSAADASPKADSAAKPKVAVFPLSGDAAEALRDRCGFALRTKLGRDGTYDPVEGPDMKDLVAEADPPVGFDTSSDAVRKLADGANATVLVWGDLKNAGGGGEGGARTTLRLKILDLRQSGAKPREISKAINEPTDLRFVTEQVLQMLPGVAEFTHPNEEPVHEDELSKALWAKNPNLVVNGSFSESGGWTALYRSEKYAMKIGDSFPELDKVNICKLPADLGPGAGEATSRFPNVLAMRVSKECAENNGMACLSEPVKIQPNTRYRISFRYKSDGPATHVFVKGYTTGKDVKGEKTDREVFRTQVNPTGAANGNWETVVADVNPDHPTFPVETLRVDLYAYLTPGVVLWDDVTLKAVGPLKERATGTKDQALAKPGNSTKENARP